MTQKASRNALLARAAQEDQTAEELLTPEQVKRKRDREKKRKQRDGERKEKAASTARDEREWWEGNRSALSSEDLKTMQEQDAYIRDILFSMDVVVNVQESDPELISIVVDLVKQHGTAHLGYATRDANIPPDWSSQSYWQNPALLAALENENKQTAQYVRYGLLAALPDWRVVQFLEKAGWSWLEAADLVGYVHTSNLKYR